MIGQREHILELGCSDGIGASILAERASLYTGVDLDKPSLEISKQNLHESKYTFIHEDFMGKAFGAFDAIVSLDVIEHILPEYEDIYFQTIMSNITENGICVIGTPLNNFGYLLFRLNKGTDPFASTSHRFAIDVRDGNYHPKHAMTCYDNEGSSFYTREAESFVDLASQNVIKVNVTLYALINFRIEVLLPDSSVSSTEIGPCDADYASVDTLVLGSDALSVTSIDLDCE